MPRSPLLTAASAWLLIAVLLALAILAWRGTAARYVTDDYCSAATLQELGFTRAQFHHRQTWSGRFSYYAVKGLLESIGPATARFTPAVLLVLFVASLTFALRRHARPLAAVTVAAVLTFALIDSSPGFWDAYLWETGSLTYTMPLILLAAWVGLLDSAASTTMRCAAGAAILFFAGGLSETTLATQATVAGGVLAWALLRQDRPTGWIATSGLAATLLAFAVVVSAPGNAVRTSSLPPRPSLLSAPVDALEYANRYLGSYAFGEWGALLLAFAIGGFLALAAPELRYGAAAAIAALAYAVSFFPAAWVQTATPPTRVLHVSHFFLLVTLAACGAVLSARVGPRPAAVAVLLLLVSAVPLAASRYRLPEIAEARREAVRIDALDADLRRRRGQPVTLHDRWFLDSGFLRAEPDHWVNDCVRRYYGLRSLAVEPH